LRARAEQEGGPGSLETFAPQPGSNAGPDPAALAAALPALSLLGSRRYLLADGVERWTAKQAEPVIDGLASLPPQTTVVLIAREQPPKVKAPKKLVDAVKAAGGEVHAFEAPKARQLPGWLREEAMRRGFALEPDAAALLAPAYFEGDPSEVGGPLAYAWIETARSRDERFQGVPRGGMGVVADAFVAAAERAGADLHVVDVPNGQHSFDLLDDTDESRTAIDAAITAVAGRLTAS